MPTGRGITSMIKASRAIFWMLFGIWIATTIAIGIQAWNERGSSMPICTMMFFPWLLGGVVVFFLLHCLIRKLWPETTSEDQSVKRWGRL